MNFSQSIATCFSKFATFKGRATRPEYWWFVLFGVLMGWGAGIADRSGTAETVVNLVLVLPTMAVATRRLHDTGRSGWWQLLAFTVIGLIPLIYWLAQPGRDESV